MLGRLCKVGVLLATGVALTNCSHSDPPVAYTTVGSTSGSTGQPGTSSTGSSGTTGSSSGSTSASSSTGSTGAVDAGSLDAGSVTLPTTQGWQFYGPQQGGPTTVLGVSADQGGNIWVAGGEEGLFLLRAGASHLERFTMDDGLHPYGFLADGGTATRRYLKVISVAGGPAGTAFVGYAGLPPGPGELDCESNWDGPNPDPAIYKSGDADKVVLNGSGIQVVHYDIFSGPGVVSSEPRGREKLCSILRIAYDPNTQSVWFGGNHGYAWGDPHFTEGYSANHWGQPEVSGVQEHAHPAFNGCSDEACTDTWFVTGGYYGLGLTPAGDVWVAGANRTMLCRYASSGRNFWQCEADGQVASNRLDLWPDAVEDMSKPSQRTDDNASSATVATDGSVWIGSFDHGLAHLDASGHLLGYLTSGLIDSHVWSLSTDPSDGSLWVGGGWGGVTRLKGGQVMPYDASVFGNDLITSPATDIQFDRSGSQRRVLVGFEGSPGKPGAIGVYSGN